MSKTENPNSEPQGLLPFLPHRKPSKEVLEKREAIRKLTREKKITVADLYDITAPLALTQSRGRKRGALPSWPPSRLRNLPQREQRKIVKSKAIETLELSNNPSKPLAAVTEKGVQIRIEIPRQTAPLADSDEKPQKINLVFEKAPPHRHTLSLNHRGNTEFFIRLLSMTEDEVTLKRIPFSSNSHYPIEPLNNYLMPEILVALRMEKITRSKK